MKTLSILGTGWLGLELAKALQNKFKIKVSSRTNEKLDFYKDLGFEAHVLNEFETKELDKLLKCDYLLINFPPSKFEEFPKFLNTIYSNENYKTIKKTIFVSSTSIYPKDDGIYKEDFAIKNSSSKKVFEAEEVSKGKVDVILRCSGLIGGNRVAGRRLSKKEVYDGESKINHVHRVDVIRAIEFVLEKEINGIFNICAPKHPTKKEVYSKNSEIFGFEAPIFVNTSKINRVINGSKITSLGFKYKFEDPLDFPI